MTCLWPQESVSGAGSRTQMCLILTHCSNQWNETVNLHFLPWVSRLLNMKLIAVGNVELCKNFKWCMWQMKQTQVIICHDVCMVMLYCMEGIIFIYTKAKNQGNEIALPFHKMTHCLQLNIYVSALCLSFRKINVLFFSALKFFLLCYFKREVWVFQ